jgi:thiosulfate/3-mercaptopyruvate sulfurtransferase
MAQGGALESGSAEFGGEKFAAQVEPGAVVSTAEIERDLVHLGPRLVDARAPERYAGAVEPIDAVGGHVPGAVNHPFTSNLDADGRFLPAAELKQRWHARLAGGDAGNLVAMCGSGVTACHNLLSLEVAGLPGARLYAGSWSEWIRDPRRPVARGGAP